MNLSGVVNCCFCFFPKALKAYFMAALRTLIFGAPATTLHCKRNTLSLKTDSLRFIHDQEYLGNNTTTRTTGLETNGSQLVTD